MARIAGVDLPRDKRIEYALTYIFGIGLKTSQNILKIFMLIGITAAAESELICFSLTLTGYRLEVV